MPPWDIVRFLFKTAVITSDDLFRWVWEKCLLIQLHILSENIIRSFLILDLFSEMNVHFHKLEPMMIGVFSSKYWLYYPISGHHIPFKNLIARFYSFSFLSSRTVHYFLFFMLFFHDCHQWDSISEKWPWHKINNIVSWNFLSSKYLAYNVWFQPHSSSQSMADYIYCLLDHHMNVMWLSFI